MTPLPTPPTARMRGMKWWNAVLPVVTLVLGYLLTLWAESRRDSRASREAAAVRDAEHRIQLISERRAFELETLQDCAVAIGRLARAAGRAHHFDVTAAKDAGLDRYVNFQLPTDINDELFEANRNLARLEARVLDAPAREAIGKFRSDVAQLGLPDEKNLAMAERLLTGLAHSADAAQELVSTRLRGIYDGSISLHVGGQS